MVMDPVAIAVAEQEWTMNLTRRVVLQQIQLRLMKQLPKLSYTLNSWMDGEWHHRWDTQQGVSELTIILMIKVARKTNSPQSRMFQWFTPTQIPKLSAWDGREAVNILFASAAGLIPDAPLPDSWRPGRHASPTGSSGKRQNT